MESLVEHVDEFNAYVEDMSNFMGREIFCAVCAYGDVERMEKLLTRSLYITKAMIERSPEIFHEMLYQYRLDWILWVKAPGITDPDIIDRQYATSDMDREIDGQTAYERFLSIGDADEESDSECIDEMKMIDGRLRWYQQRVGSLYCGLYAIQHVLNNDSEITQNDLDTLAPITLSNAAVDDETKDALLADYIDPNGNYNIRTLVRAIENAGYVTRLKYDFIRVEDIQIDNVKGIIVNRARSHWYACRPIGDNQWEICDSMIPSTIPFPIKSAEQICTTIAQSPCFVVIVPDIKVPDWVQNGHKKRLAQILWQMANPEDS